MVLEANRSNFNNLNSTFKFNTLHSHLKLIYSGITVFECKNGRLGNAMFRYSVDTELTLVFSGSFFFLAKSLISLNSLLFLTALKIFLILLLMQLNLV